MKAVVFGASGMIGRGVVRECVGAADVSEVLTVARRASDAPQDPKVRELVHADFTDFAPQAAALTGFDACFYCLGVTSSGLREAEYARVTYDFTIAAARVLVAANPGMTFVFVS